MKYHTGLALAALLCASVAQAEVIGVVNATHGVVINLHFEQDVCKEGKRLAEYIDLIKKINVRGCWEVQAGGFVSVDWADGDVGRIPLGVIEEPKTT